MGKISAAELTVTLSILRTARDSIETFSGTESIFSSQQDSRVRKLYYDINELAMCCGEIIDEMSENREE